MYRIMDTNFVFPTIGLRVTIKYIRGLLLTFDIKTVLQSDAHWQLMTSVVIMVGGVYFAQGYVKLIMLIGST